MATAITGGNRNLVSAIALCTALISPVATLAQEVVLKSADGTVNLVGEFIEFKDNNYVIRTDLGDLRISATRVRCEGEPCPSTAATEADVTIAGSQSVGVGVMPLLLSGYGAFLGADVTVSDTPDENEIFAEIVGEEGFGDPLGSYLVSSTGSIDAFRGLLDRSAQIGMSSRRIRPAEARALRDDGAGNMVAPENEHIFAVDSLVVITHPNNTIDQITTDELRGIYSGKITNWSEIGGADAPIVVYGRADDTGTRSTFEERLYGADVPTAPPNMTITATSTEMAASVNADPNGIGFVGYAFQRGAKPLTLINECGLRMTPDTFSARTEEYALQRFLYLYNRADTLDEKAADFVDYVTSDAADSVISKAGFIDLGIARQPQTADSTRAQQLNDADVDPFEAGVIRDMLAQMGAYDRLSSTFRFRTGSSTLDRRGLLNLARLADYLESAPAGTKVLMVGFTDDVGAFESNRALSVGRAQQVLTTLQDFAGDRLSGVDFQTAGYGEIAPSACNTTETGRAINRRVEIWVQAANG